MKKHIAEKLKFWMVFQNFWNISPILHGDGRDGGEGGYLRKVKQLLYFSKCYIKGVIKSTNL